MNGAMEITPKLEMADKIVDLVSSGKTLLANDLVEIENILAISGYGNTKKMIDAGKTINPNSIHLVKQIKDLSKGKYLIIMLCCYNNCPKLNFRSLFKHK